MINEHMVLRPAGKAGGPPALESADKRALQAALSGSRKRLEAVARRVMAEARLTQSELEHYRRMRQRIDGISACGDVKSLCLAGRLARHTRRTLERAAARRDGPVGRGPGRPDRIAGAPTDPRAVEGDRNGDDA